MSQSSFKVICWNRIMRLIDCIFPFQWTTPKGSWSWSLQWILKKYIYVIYSCNHLQFVEASIKQRKDAIPCRQDRFDNTSAYDVHWNRLFHVLWLKRDQNVAYWLLCIRLWNNRGDGGCQCQCVMGVIRLARSLTKMDCRERERERAFYYVG